MREEESETDLEEEASLADPPPIPEGGGVRVFAVRTQVLLFRVLRKLADLPPKWGSPSETVVSYSETRAVG